MNLLDIKTVVLDIHSFHLLFERMLLRMQAHTVQAHIPDYVALGKNFKEMVYSDKIHLLIEIDKKL